MCTVVELTKEMEVIKERATSASVCNLDVAMDKFKDHILRGKDHDLSKDDEWKVRFYMVVYFPFSYSHTLLVCFYFSGKLC